MSGKFRLLLRPLANVYLNQMQGQRAFHRWVAPTLKVLNKRKKEMGPEPPQKRSNFVEWNYKAELYSFGQRLGEEFDDSLLREALTEESYVRGEEERQRAVGIEPDLQMTDNRELAERGGHLIERTVDNYLKALLPRLPHDHIQSIKEDLLREENLAHISSNLGINDLVVCAETPAGRETLARALKGVIGALAETSGEDRASLFVRDFILTQLAGKDLSELCTPHQPLVALRAALGGRNTESRLIAESGRNSLLANYQVGIYLDKKLVGRGSGESVERAEEMAALDGLWRLWGVRPNRRPFHFNLQLSPSVSHSSPSLQ